MPLLDHFHPPLSKQRFWNTFHHAWAAAIARNLNRHLLSSEYFAVPALSMGPQVDIDVATFEEAASSTRPATDGNTLTYAAPPATLVVPFSFSEIVGVEIFHEEGGPELVAAIELASPANKDRPDHRQAFTAKMATYLHQGVSLIVIDIVTTRTAHLHNEWIATYELPQGRMSEDPQRPLYANSYRPMQSHVEGRIAM